MLLELIAVNQTVKRMEFIFLCISNDSKNSLYVCVLARVILENSISREAKENLFLKAFFYFIILILSSKVEKRLDFCLSVCDVHVLVKVNNLRMSWNWLMFFRFTMECFMKMVHIGTTVHVKENSENNSNTQRSMDRKF